MMKVKRMSVVRDNASTLYRQIAGRLRDEIATGRFDPAGRLPSEAELGQRFGVSRVTVRLALTELATDGLIEQRKGKGTYVAGRQVHHELDRLQSFHESLRLQGFDAGMRILRLERRTSPPEIVAAFGPAWKTCTFLERLHFIGEEPIALGRSFLPPGLADLSIEDAESRPTYAILTAHTGLVFDRARVTLGATNADPEMEAPLNIQAGAALLLMQRTSYFVDNKPAERSVFHIRPERYSFAINSYSSGAIS
jgi:GntR family transcriptional regulator